MLDIFKDKIKNFTLETCFTLLLWTALAIGLHFVFNTLNADRTVKGYYLNSFGTSAGIAYQVKMSIDYMVDPVAFTSNDYKATLDTLVVLNK